MTDDLQTPEGSPLPAPSLLYRSAQVWRAINARKVVQWTIAYIALAYSIQHGVVLTGEAFDWPHAVQRIAMLLLVLGLPVVVTIAWYHGDRGSQRVSGPELTIISTLFVIGSILFLVFVHPAEESGTAETQRASIAGSATSSATQAGVISIAVLPFVNLSSDAEQEFFSDGMTEEITSALAKVPGLTVIGRTSAFEFKGQNKDLRMIGQALGTTHLIEGSVRKAGTRVRITAQLIVAESGTHLWTENYDRELTDVFAIQEDIAQAIAGALRVPLGLQVGGRLVSNRSIDAESYQQYLRAKALVRTRGITPLSDATALLEMVVSRDADYAPAWALLAQAYALTPSAGSTYRYGSAEELRRIVDASLPRADTAARRAIQLDANDADGYSSLGLVENLHGNLLRASELY